MKRCFAFAGIVLLLLTSCSNPFWPEKPEKGKARPTQVTIFTVTMQNDCNGTATATPDTAGQGT